ncbi:MAG: helix-turn-helix domain-containing protein [Pseudanabaena sp.]|jgi:transcriptional regulator with XRE-family HTH domain
MGNIGRRLRQARKEQKLSLRSASEMAEISVAYLSKIENDEANPTLEILERLAVVLKMRLDELTASSNASDFGNNMPESLKSFIDDYKERFNELNQPDWQNLLKNVRLRGRYPQKSEDWLTIFLDARRAFETDDNG